VRIVKAEDGREVLQIRQPLGVEQYELDGRPDGLTPEGRSTYLELFQERLERHIEENGSEAGFVIGHDDFLLLQNEGVLNYYRYLVLFQIGDFERTARDTGQNLALCELVERHGESEEDKKDILQYKPYILRMHAISKAMLSLHRQMSSAARKILEAAIEEIEKMSPIDTPAFQFERLRSLNYLRSTLKQVLEQKVSPLDRLKVELEAAVEEEDYEKAADLRDRIRALKKEFEL
jgi:hypothetical protein